MEEASDNSATSVGSPVEQYDLCASLLLSAEERRSKGIKTVANTGARSRRLASAATTPGMNMTQADCVGWEEAPSFSLFSRRSRSRSRSAPDSEASHTTTTTTTSSSHASTGSSSPSPTREHESVSSTSPYDFGTQPMDKTKNETGDDVDTKFSGMTGRDKQFENENDDNNGDGSNRGHGGAVHIHNRQKRARSRAAHPFTTTGVVSDTVSSSLTNAMMSTGANLNAATQTAMAMAMQHKRVRQIRRQKRQRRGLARITGSVSSSSAAAGEDLLLSTAAEALQPLVLPSPFRSEDEKEKESAENDEAACSDEGTMTIAINVNAEGIMEPEMSQTPLSSEEQQALSADATATVVTCSANAVARVDAPVHVQARARDATKEGPKLFKGLEGFDVDSHDAITGTCASTFDKENLVNGNKRRRRHGHRPQKSCSSQDENVNVTVQQILSEVLHPPLETQRIERSHPRNMRDTFDTEFINSRARAKAANDIANAKANNDNVPFSFSGNKQHGNSNPFSVFSVTTSASTSKLNNSNSYQPPKLGSCLKSTGTTATSAKAHAPSAHHSFGQDDAQGSSFDTGMPSKHACHGNVQTTASAAAVSLHSRTEKSIKLPVSTEQPAAPLSRASSSLASNTQIMKTQTKPMPAKINNPYCSSKVSKVSVTVESKICSEGINSHNRVRSSAPPSSSMMSTSQPSRTSRSNPYLSSQPSTSTSNHVDNKHKHSNHSSSSLNQGKNGQRQSSMLNASNEGASASSLALLKGRDSVTQNPAAPEAVKSNVNPYLLSAKGIGGVSTGIINNAACLAHTHSNTTPQVLTSHHDRHRHRSPNNTVNVPLVTSQEAPQFQTRVDAGRATSQHKPQQPNTAINNHNPLPATSISVPDDVKSESSAVVSVSIQHMPIKSVTEVKAEEEEDDPFGDLELDESAFAAMDSLVIQQTQSMAMADDIKIDVDVGVFQGRDKVKVNIPTATALPSHAYASLPYDGQATNIKTEGSATATAILHHTAGDFKGNKMLQKNNDNDDPFGDLPDFDFDQLDQLVNEHHSCSQPQSQPQRDESAKDEFQELHVPAGTLVKNPLVELPQSNHLNTNTVDIDHGKPEFLTCARFTIMLVQDNPRTFSKTIHVTPYKERKDKGKREFEEYLETVKPLQCKPLLLQGEWYFSTVQRGDTIHVVSLSGKWRVDFEVFPLLLHTQPPPGSVEDDLLMIVHPDVLLAPSTVSEALECSRRGVLRNKMGSGLFISE
jgi:hypothetical protein